MERISIIGASGAGKSTLAVKLGSLFDLPVYHLDCVYLKENWETTTKEYVAEIVAQIIPTAKWVIEGNYRLTLPDRFLYSDLVIFLDYGPDFCKKSVTDRFHQSDNRVGLPDYLYQQETLEGLQHLYGHIDRFHQKSQEDFGPLIEKYKNKVLTFTTREDLDKWVKSLKPF